MMARGQHYEMDLCSGAILPKLLRFTIPLMFSSILQLLFNAADIVVVGRFAGDNALAAVGSNASLISLLVNLFIGLSVGANILAARYYGANAKKELEETVHTAMLLGLVSGCLLAAAGILGAKTILIWMQSPENVLPLAALYLRIYFLGMPATMLYNFGAALLRAIGDTRRPLYFLSVAGIVNVVLNLFFVIVCHLDVAGVGIATVISQCISAALVIRCMMREQGAIHLDPRQLRICRPRLKQILYTGLPAGFQGVLFSLSNVMIQSSINSFGEVVMAGNAAACNIESFVYAAMNAFYQTNISFTSQNLGAGKVERILPILLRAQLCVIITGLVAGSAACFGGPWLLTIYSSSPAVISAGMDRLRIVCLTYVLCGMMDTMVGSLRGMGYSVMPMLVSLIGACGLRLVWLATIFKMDAFHTVQTVYWSYPISWLLTLSVHILCFIWALRNIKKQHLHA